MYRAMRLARTFEQKLAALYRQGKIVGAVYLGMGQEAICTGVVSLLQKDDYFSTVARGLAGWFLRGVEPRHVMARWFGKDMPPVARPRARVCSSPICSNYGIAPYHNGSMASWIPSGAGFALAFKLPARAARLCGAHRRRRDEPRRFLRGPELRRHPQAAARGHRREQLLRVLDADSRCRCRCATWPIVRRRSTFPAAIGFGNDIFEVRRAGAHGDRSRAQRGTARIWSSSRLSGSAATASTTTWRYVPADLREFWERRDPVRLFAGVSARRGRRVRGRRRARSTRSARRVVEDAVDVGRGAADCPIRRPVTRQAVRRMRRHDLSRGDLPGLREEMRRDPDVILLGEDIGVFGGAFKITRGFLEEFGAERVIDTPISESGFVGAACAAAIEGLPAGRRVPVRGLHRLRVRSDRELRGEGVLPLGHAGAGRVPRAVGRRVSRRPVSFAEPGGLVHARARA